MLYKIHVKLNLGIDFTSFIYNYLVERIIIPLFSSKFGPKFSPKSGVPQGSVLGPILFLIFVYDIPEPIYNNTIVAQFADDVVHVVISDCTNHMNRATNVVSKLKREVTRTIEWEENWKIKTCFEKCYVGFSGTSKYTLENIGGISIRGHPIEIKNNIKILGYTLTNYLTPSMHVQSIQAIAHTNITKLLRFSDAPIKIKKYLYLSLIRPLIEYPCHELSQSNITHIRSLQRVQNRALRFIYNIKPLEHIRSETLHNRA